MIMTPNGLREPTSEDIAEHWRFLIDQEESKREIEEIERQLKARRTRR